MTPLLMERIFLSTPSLVHWYTLSDCWVCDWSVQYYLCNTLRGVGRLSLVDVHLVVNHRQLKPETLDLPTKKRLSLNSHSFILNGVSLDHSVLA